jgi:hypothetical protein
MKHRYLAKTFAVAALVVCGPMAYGQAPAAPNPAPKAGVMIEPVQGKGGPEAKFTNNTDGDLAIQYGKNKLALRSGEAKKLPIPQQQLFDLKIFERRLPDGQFIPRFDGKAAPNDKKRFIPFPWAKPNKQEKAQQAGAGNP